MKLIFFFPPQNLFQPMCAVARAVQSLRGDQIFPLHNLTLYMTICWRKRAQRLVAAEADVPPRTKLQLIGEQILDFHSSGGQKPDPQMNALNVMLVLTTVRWRAPCCVMTKINRHIIRSRLTFVFTRNQTQGGHSVHQLCVSAFVPLCHVLLSVCTAPAIFQAIFSLFAFLKYFSCAVFATCNSLL